MRSFPSASRQRLAAAAVAGVVAFGAVATPSAPWAHADDDLKHQQKHVQGEIKGATHDLDESSAALRKAFAAANAARAQLGDAKGDLHSVRVKLDAARALDAKMADRLAAAEDRLVTARDELQAGREALATQRDLVRDRVAESYMNGNPDLAALQSLVSSRSLEDLVRSQTAATAILDKESSMYDELDEAEVLLKIRENKVAEAKQEVAAEREQAAEHLVTVKQLTAEAVTARDKVRKLVTERLRARRQAYAAKRHDRLVLARLKKQEARIQAQIAAAARRARGSSVSASPSGYLLRPVPGAVTSPFGYRIHPIYHYWGLHDGTDFGVACGEPMKAAGTGTVISKYYSEVYGNRLYLSLGQVNGKSLTVVYNHAERYNFDVGDHVQRGQVVGYVGSTGWSTGCHLHFTVLVAGTAVDPMNWL